MIKTSNKPNGGEIRVEHGRDTAHVDFTITNQGYPVLCLTCRTKQGNAKLTENIVSALVEKYSPLVMVLETPMKELKYAGKFQPLLRCDSLFINNREHREFFEKLITTAEAIDSWAFVNKKESSIDFYKRHAILKMIRENTTPFEFLSIKEECDYSARERCSKGFREVVQVAKSSLEHCHQHKTCLESVVKYLEKTGEDEFRNSCDTTNGMKKCVTELIVPSIIWLGESHSFVQSIVKTFDAEATKYYEDSNEFLKAFEISLKEISADKSNQNSR